MKLFKDFLVEQKETVKTHAERLIKTGNYDPNVRGNQAKFIKDLKATGITNSDKTCHYAWKDVKHLHNTSETKSTPTKSKESSVVGLSDEQVRRTNKIDDERYGTHKNEDGTYSYTHNNFHAPINTHNDENAHHKEKDFKSAKQLAEKAKALGLKTPSVVTDFSRPKGSAHRHTVVLQPWYYEHKNWDEIENEYDKKKYENVGIQAYGSGFDSKTMKRHYV